MDCEMHEEFDSLEQILLCSLCKCKFEDPIVLPCQRSICSKHVILELTNDKYSCKLCDKKHLIPNKGFLRNDELNRLLKVSNNYVLKESLLGKNNVRAKELCYKLGELIQKAELIANDPLLYIHEYFRDLRGNIDLEREKSIQLINDEYFRILKELEEDEKIYITVKNQQVNLELKEKINLVKLDLSQWNKISNDPILNDKKEWFHLQLNIEKKISMLDYMLSKYQSNLLFNKEYQFVLKPAVDTSTFGSLHKYDLILPDEDRLEETICFEIPDFKAFIEDKFDRLHKDWIVINKISWKFIAEINQNINYELILFVYSIPDCSDEVLEANPFRALVSYKLLKASGGVFKEKTFEHTFIGDYFNGIKMCSLREIMNETNNVYDHEKDSIKISINFKVIF